MRRLILCLLAAWMTGIGYAQPVYEWDPAACIRQGLQHNRALQAVRAQAVGATAGYHEARTLRLPAFSAVGSYQRLSPNIPDFEVAFPLGTDPASEIGFSVPAILNRYDLGLRLEQPLFTGFGLHHQIRAVGFEAEAADWNVRAAEAGLALEIEQAYWLLFKTQALQAVVDEALQQVEAHLTDTRNRLAAGMALQSDVLALQTRHAALRLEQVDARHAVRLARLDLNNLLGLPLDAEIRTVETVAVTPSVASPDALVAEAFRQRPDAEALAREARASEAGVGAARAGWYPQVSLVGAYHYARPNTYLFPIEDTFKGTWEAGLSVRFDLWNWGRTRDQVQQARARADYAAARLDDFRETVRLNVLRQVLMLERAEVAVAVAAESVQEAQEAYRVMGERYGQGMALTTEVLAAEVARREARTYHTGALADYAVARAALHHAVGRPPVR